MLVKLSKWHFAGYHIPFYPKFLIKDPMKLSLSPLAAICCAGALSAQTTVLSEDFNAGVVPPTGWSTQNLNANGLALGWTVGSTGDAYHADELGVSTCDNMLATPVMDLSALTSAYVHYNGYMGFISYLDAQSVDVSTDGGLTWTIVFSDLGLNNASDLVDISAYAGQASVMVGFHYTGDYAHNMSIDNVVVDDNGVIPPPPGENFVVNLPATFASLPLLEDFSTGIVPSHMALTATDDFGVADIEAYCSIANGQLEMGLDPLSTNYHNVRNAMVLGIDGASMAGAMLDFDMNNYGEEAHEMDGVHCSDDGVNWFEAMDGWGLNLEEVDIDLSCGGLVDISGNFYVMVGQNDNFPYAYLDGIDVDNLNIDDQAGHGGGPPPGLTYSISGLVAGGVATFAVANAVPGSNVIIGYSLSGAGPISTGYGLVDMTPPISTFPTLVADASGDAVFSPTVPVGAAGLTLYTQGLNVGVLTNSLAELVL
ncbi:MAG: hypothetical protein ACI84O_001382 [Myxococcota bacterium]